MMLCEKCIYELSKGMPQVLINAEYLNASFFFCLLICLRATSVKGVNLFKFS